MELSPTRSMFGRRQSSPAPGIPSSTWRPVTGAPAAGRGLQPGHGGSGGHQRSGERSSYLVYDSSEDDGYQETHRSVCLEVG